METHYKPSMTISTTKIAPAKRYAGILSRVKLNLKDMLALVTDSNQYMVSSKVLASVNGTLNVRKHTFARYANRLRLFIGSAAQYRKRTSAWQKKQDNPHGLDDMKWKYGLASSSICTSASYYFENQAYFGKLS
jgi:hypothetical protein